MYQKPHRGYSKEKEERKKIARFNDLRIIQLTVCRPTWFSQAPARTDLPMSIDQHYQFL